MGRFKSSTATQRTRAYPSLRLLVPLILVVLASITGIKKFEAWDQVSTLWDSGIAPILLVDNPHLLRFLVVYPGFMLEEIHPGVGFSIYIGIFFAINCVVWRQIVFRSIGRGPPLWAWVVFVAAHASMNGRGVLAWTAWLLCVAISIRILRQSKSVIGESPKVLLSCFLATVSTGVFVVVFSAFVLTMIRHARTKRAETRRGMVYIGRIAIVAVMGVFADIPGLQSIKISSFSAGGSTGQSICSVMEPAPYSVGISVGVTLSIWAMMVAILLGLRLAFGRPLPIEVLFTLLPLAGGLFGYTVLTLSIPMILVLAARLVAQRQSSRVRRRYENLLAGIK